MTNKLTNATLVLYAFHLRNELSDVDEPTNNSKYLWRKIESLNTEDRISELKDFSQKINTNSHSVGDYLELLTLNTEAEEEQHFLKFKVSGSELIGMVYPLQIHDTFAVDIAVNYQCEIEIETNINYSNGIEINDLNNLTLKNSLLPQNFQADLGHTLLLYIANKETEIESCKALAQECFKALLPEIKHEEYSLNSGSFLNSPIFEFDNGQEKSTNNLHVLIWFPSNSSLEEFATCQEYLRYLLCCRAKMLFSYSESRKSRSELKKLYNQLKNIAKNPEYFDDKPLDDKLNTLKEKLDNLALDSFNYIRQLRDLDIQHTTIKTNAKNYKIYIDKLQKINPEKNELQFLEDFRKYAHSKLASQIRVDLSYFDSGKELYAETIAYIRGIAQITQTQSDRQLDKQESDRDRDLQNTVAIVGFGIGSAQIGVSVGTGLISQAQPSQPTQPSSNYLHPSVLLILFSIIFGIVGACFGWLLTLQTTRDGFKKFKDIVDQMWKPTKLPNPHQEGKICILLPKDNPELQGKSECWGAITHVGEYSCTIKTWEAEYTVKIEHLLPLELSDDDCKFMRELLERMRRLHQLPEHDDVVDNLLTFFGKQSQPYLTPIQEELLTIIEKKYGLGESQR